MKFKNCTSATQTVKQLLNNRGTLTGSLLLYGQCSGLLKMALLGQQQSAKLAFTAAVQCAGECYR